MKSQDYGLPDQQRSSSFRWLYLLFAFSLGVIALWTVTELTAVRYGHAAALGAPWFRAGGYPVYAPWSVVTWYFLFGDPHGVIDQASNYGLLIFFLPQALVMAYVASQAGMKGNRKLHGSARWATRKEVGDMGYLHGRGVYIGGYVLPKSRQIMYLRHDGPEHVLAFAPTRSGKGVGLILPTLLSWPGPSMTLDIKGENWALTSGWRKSQGHTVLRFDPTDPSGNSAAFNPLEELRLFSEHAISDAQNLALLLVDPLGKGLDDHWSKSGFAFLAPAILHCCVMIWSEHERPATLTDLSLMLADENRTIDELLQEMIEEDHAARLRGLAPHATGGDEIHIFIAAGGREMLNKADKERSSVLSTVVVNLALYRDPIIGRNTSHCDFRIDDLMNREEPVDLYLVLPASDTDRVIPLVRIIFDMVVRRITSKMEFKDGKSVAPYRHRLLFMLDEFPSIGRLPIIEKAITYIAGFGGIFYIIIQNIEQLGKVYGKDNSILGNSHILIAYASNNPATCEILSKMSGTTTVVQKKKSVSGKAGSRSPSFSIQETARPLLTPDECSRLPGMRKSGDEILPGDMLIFTAGRHPIYGKQILHFKDPVFLQRARIPAPDVTDSLYFPRQTAEPASEAPKGKSFEDYLEE